MTIKVKNMKENDNKEINLLQLLEITINWIKSICLKALNFIGRLIQLLCRHTIITAIVVVICLGTSMFLTRPEARIYKAEALCIAYGSDAQTVREISKQLENTSPVNKLTSIATKLSLPDSIAKNIIGFHSYYIIEYLKDHIAVAVDYKDNYSLKDTMYVKKRDRVYMQILTKNVNQIPVIEKAVLNFFNNNEMLKTHFTNARNQISQQIKVSTLELARVDSLAKVSYLKDNNQQMRLDNNRLIVGEQQKQLFYNDLLRLQEINSNSKSDLENFKQPLEIPSGFVINPVPINSTLKYCFYSLMIALILSIIIAGFIENSKHISNFLKGKS